MPRTPQPRTVDLPRAGFPGLFTASPGYGEVRKYRYSPAPAFRLYLLVALLWYAGLLLIDPRIVDSLDINETFVRPPQWLTYLIDVLYPAGLFWLFSALVPFLYRGGIRIDRRHDSVFFLLSHKWERRRFRKKLSDIEEVVFVEGYRGGVFLCGKNNGFCCLRVAGAERGGAQQREYALWLAGWIGCAWCHLDRRGRIIAHLPCP